MGRFVRGRIRERSEQHGARRVHAQAGGQHRQCRCRRGRQRRQYNPSGHPCADAQYPPGDWRRTVYSGSLRLRSWRQPTGSLAHESFGRGRYRFTLPVDPAQHTEVLATYSVQERFNEALTMRIDHNGDGRLDVAQFGEGAEPAVSGNLQPVDGEAAGRIAFIVREEEFPANEDEVMRSVRLHASDGDVADDQMRQTQLWVQRQVAEDAQYRYTIDIGDDGSFETIRGLDPVADFLSPRDVGNVVIAGWAEVHRENVTRFVFQGSSYPIRHRALSIHASSAWRPRCGDRRERHRFWGDSVTISVDWGMERRAVAASCLCSRARLMHVLRAKFACAPPTDVGCSRSMFSRSTSPGQRREKRMWQASLGRSDTHRGYA